MINPYDSKERFKLNEFIPGYVVYADRENDIPQFLYSFIEFIVSLFEKRIR